MEVFVKKIYIIKTNIFKYESKFSNWVHLHQKFKINPSVTWQLLVQFLWILFWTLAFIDYLGHALVDGWIIFVYLCYNAWISKYKISPIS